MGLLKLFKEKIQMSFDADASAARQMSTRRLHTRYVLNHKDLCYLENAAGLKFNVVDLSFSACFVEPIDPGQEGLREESNISTTLNFLGHKIGLNVSSIKKRKQGWVVSFLHAGENTILDLSKVIESIRCGSTAIEIALKNQNDAFKSKLRKRFMGDGPFDLVVEKDSKGQVQFAMITQRKSEVYFSVLWENGAVITKKNLDLQGIGARMGQTPTPETELVFYAACSCIGMKDELGHAVGRLLSDWLAKEKHSV